MLHTIASHCISYCIIWCSITHRSVPLYSCGCPGLERIWEADLEACHLFLRGLQLRTPSCSGGDIDDLPTAALYPPTQPCTKEEEDCAMLTALGGRWCPEANLQNSEFTKVNTTTSRIADECLCFNAGVHDRLMRAGRRLEDKRCPFEAVHC